MTAELKNQNKQLEKQLSLMHNPIRNKKQILLNDS